LFYYGAPTAGNAVFTINGGQKPGSPGCEVVFLGSSGDIISAGTATFINNGGNGANSFGGFTEFNSEGTTASQARLIANGGENGGGGGDIFFVYGSDGGEAQIEVYGNGHLDISAHDLPGLTIGSLAGDGLAYLASRNLTIGSNNLSTTFSGIIQESGSGTGTNGSVTKIGIGTLTLSGASTYKGGTTVSTGTLLVKNTTGSATGTGAVTVSGGILGGRGIISGATTIGTGNGVSGFLQPGKGATTATTLTIQNSLTFKSNGTYTWKLNSKKAKSDQVIASGVTVEAGAQFDFTTIGNTKLTAGKVFTAISNTAATPISGPFANLADGSTVTVGVNKLQVSYSGGDGNDLTLTVVP
jgi:autotransporter-associated beta strand protein